MALKTYDYGITKTKESELLKSYTTPKDVIITSDYTPYDGNYSISNMFFSELSSVFLTAEALSDDKYICVTLPKKVFVYEIETPSLPYDGWFSTGEIVDENDNILGSFDTRSNSTVSINKIMNKIKIRFKSGGTFGASFQFLKMYYSDNLFLIKKDNKFYSLKEDNYDSINKEYKEITFVNTEAFWGEKGISEINSLFTEITIDTETFKPIDKFDNFQLVAFKDIKGNLNAIKYKRGMSIANGDFSLRLASNIDYFNSESTIGANCSIKVVVSKDSGSTWLTTSDNGVVWTKLTNTVPMKAYSELTDSEKTQWDKLMEEIATVGVNLTDLNSIDFNTLNADKLRFAYVFDANSASDTNIITKLQWQFDSIGDYEQMSNDTDVNISITNNAIKIKPLKDYELMKINVGVSSDKSLVEGITYPTKEDLNNYLDKTTYASRVNEGYVKKAESAKTLELDSSAKLNGNRMYIGTSYGGDADSTEVRLREFPVGSTTDRIDTLTYPILTKDVPQTIEFLKEIPEVNCFAQAFEQEEGTQDVTEVFESYINPLVSNHNDEVICGTTNGLSIKDSYEVTGTLNDGTGFYEINLSGLDSFIDIDNITSEVNN